MAARRRRASLDEDLSEGEEVESKVEEADVLSDKEKAGLVDSASEVRNGRKQHYLFNLHAQDSDDDYSDAAENTKELEEKKLSDEKEAKEEEEKENEQMAKETPKEEESKETADLETKLEDLEIKEDYPSEEREHDQVSKASGQKRFEKESTPSLNNICKHK